MSNAGIVQSDQRSAARGLLVKGQGDLEPHNVTMYYVSDWDLGCQNIYGECASTAQQDVGFSTCFRHKHLYDSTFVEMQMLPCCQTVPARQTGMHSFFELC